MFELFESLKLPSDASEPLAGWSQCLKFLPVKGSSYRMTVVVKEHSILLVLCVTGTYYNLTSSGASIS